MNYYQYRRRVPEAKKGSDYIKPIVAVIVFIAVIFALWKLLGAIFGGGDDVSDQVANTPDEKVQIEIETGSAKVMASDAEDWVSLDSDIDIYENEKLQTLSDGRLSLNFFEGTTGRLDKSSTLAVDTLSQGGSSTVVGVTLDKGRLWMDTTKSESLSTTVTAGTKRFKATADSGAKFAVEAPSSLYVLEGTVEADILDGSKTLKTVTVGVGQQLVLTDSIISDLADGGDNEIIFALDEDFKSSTWYEWNTKMDGGSVLDDETTTDDETTDEENKDEEDKTDEEDSNADGPSTPEITSPGENGDEVTLDKTSLFISGTVSADTEKVKVNEYVLNQYTPGSKKFTYKADVTIGNLKAGDNVFKVYAIDEDGNESKAATITLVLPQEVYDKANTEDKSETTGEVSITAPNSGNDLVTNETSFVISGTVPSNTAIVKVNGYQLQAFKAGNTTFKYNANTDLGTLKAGQKNVFEVVAYDEDGKTIGTDSMTIDLSGGADTPNPNTDSQTPSEGALSLSITMPTTASAYQTTLNQITLGGSVSGAPEAVYVNGNKVESYLNGSDKWSMTVTLQPGDNQFSVYAEKEGQATPADTITVTYSG